MERDDRDMLEVTRDWRQTLRDWLRNPDPHIPVWQAFVAFVLLVFIAVFSVNAFAPGGIGDIIGGPGEEGTDGGSDSAPAAEDADSSPAEEPAAEAEGATVEQEEASAAPAAPAHFVGTIVSDNGWFTITVTADGQASGTLNVQQTAQGDSSFSSGTFAGTIAADDVVTCNGTFTGTTSSNGQQWPHQGTVSVRAAPTTADRTVWQIDMAAEPGSAASLSAHAQ